MLKELKWQKASAAFGECRAAASLVVAPVRTRKDRAQFVGLPWQLYKNNPLWVGPLRREAKQVADPKTNPFFKHAQIEHFLARDTRAAIGRVAACIYPAYNERMGSQVGFFGFLESVPNPDVVKSLLAEAERWLAERGMQSIMGPYSYAPTQDMGLLVDGFDEPPALLQTYNPPFYEDFIVAAGYRRAWSAVSYHQNAVDVLDRMPALVAESDRICAKNGLTIRQLDLSQITKERALLLDLFNAAFAKNREVVAIAEDVFRFQTSSFVHIVDPRVCFFVQQGGREIGLGLALPNFNEILLRDGGSLRIGTLLRWKKSLRSIRTVVVAILCSRPEAKGMGLSRVIATELLRAGIAAGYEGYHTGWVDEQNAAMRAGLRRLGCVQPAKRYAVYRKELSGRAYNG